MYAIVGCDDYHLSSADGHIPFPGRAVFERVAIIGMYTVVIGGDIEIASGDDDVIGGFYGFRGAVRLVGVAF